MAVAIYDDNGIRFEYPFEWELEVSDDGPRNTVAVQSPDGPAFAFISVDTSRPEPSEMVDEALEALRLEYPQLETNPAAEPIEGHPGVGYDVEFFSLDLLNTCVLRCARTPRRTIFVLTQWSDFETDIEETLASIRSSIEETDS